MVLRAADAVLQSTNRQQERVFPQAKLNQSLTPDV